MNNPGFISGFAAYRVNYPDMSPRLSEVSPRFFCMRIRPRVPIRHEFTRRGLRINCGRSITSGDVIRFLDDLFDLHGAQAYIRSDNGPEFIAKALQKWLSNRYTITIYIDPGCPWQNPCNESFNAVFRDGCLNLWLFPSIRKRRS